MDRARGQPRRAAAARPRSRRPATRAAAADRATALLLAAWIEASSGDLEPARRHIDEAAALADGPELEARCAYYLAYVVSHHGEWEHALELTARARALSSSTPWDQAANALFAARAAISAGDAARAAAARDEVEHWLRAVDDPWLHVRRDAMLGELARARAPLRRRRRSTSPAPPRRPAGSASAQTEAYQVTSLGRAQCQAGDYEAGAATLARGIAKAEATGDVRLAALGRVHLGRVLRALGRTAEARAALERAAAFHRDAGGGEQAALGDCLLAALDAATARAARSGSRRCSRAPRRRRAGRGLRARRARPLTDDDGATRRMADARALHHRARPGRPPRWCATTNADQPPDDDRDPGRLTAVDHLAEQQEDQTTASAGCACCEMPIVPIWIVFCA